MAGDHGLAGEGDEVGIVEQGGLRLEDLGIGRAESAGGVSSISAFICRRVRRIASSSSAAPSLSPPGTSGTAISCGINA